MKKKILHVLNTGLYSGAENVAITIINNLKDDFDCYYVSLEGPIRAVLEENNIKFIPIKQLNYVELRKVVKDIKPDIIHAHDFTASVFSSFLPFKGRVISHLHNNPLWIKSVNIYSITYFLSSIRYHKILTVSDSIMKEYVYGKNLEHKTQVIFNPVDISRIQQKIKDDFIFKKYDDYVNKKILYDLLKL